MRYEVTLKMEVVTEKGPDDAKRRAIASLIGTRPADLKKYVAITVQRLSAPPPLPGQKEMFRHED